LNTLLKYYKLLVTLPRDEVAYALAALSASALSLRDPLTLLSLIVFSILFYEERVLNGRRLAFLIALSSLASLAGKRPLAALFEGVAAALYSPNPLLILLAPNVLYLASPEAVIALMPVILAVVYGKLVGTVDFGIAWLRAWMGDDYWPLERFVHDRGRTKEAKEIRVGPLVFTDAHFGLMRYSMGSVLPHLMALNGAVPHRLCGSHENNPASRWEAYALVRGLKHGREGKAELTKMKGEGVNVYVYSFEGGCVAVVEHPSGADDLPCVEWRCEVADPHNAEGPSPSPQKLLEELSSCEPTERVELKEPKVYEVEFEGEGLCERKGFLIDWGPFKHAVAFGNNAVNGKNKLEGIDLISTVDDHSCAGFGRSTYEPSSFKGFKVIKGRAEPIHIAINKVKYVAMGESMVSKEAEEVTVKSVKVGIAAAASAIMIALLA